MIALWSQLRIGVMEPPHDRTMEPLHDLGFGAPLVSPSYMLIRP
jgi:hypothetical protein